MKQLLLVTVCIIFHCTVYQGDKSFVGGFFFSFLVFCDDVRNIRDLYLRLISLSILDMYITNLLLDIYENMQLVLTWQWHNRELRGVCQSNL